MNDSDDALHEAALHEAALHDDGADTTEHDTTSIDSAGMPLIDSETPLALAHHDTAEDFAPVGTPAPGERPIIGLTTYLEQAQSGVWDVQASFLPKVYFDAVNRAGGIAVLLPPQPASASIAAAVVSTLDGLIVCGGKDIAPSRYGQAAHPETDEPRPDRDEWEETLLHAALEAEVPFLGICRGAQLLNVALGGSLHQHLPDVVGDRRYQAGGGVFNTVDVAIDPASRLGELIEADSLATQVYHHQAIDRVADGLVVTARTDDGTIEAVELPDQPFAVGVQWHPEEEADDLRLFDGLVDAARDYRRAKAAGASVTSTPPDQHRTDAPE